MELSIIVPVYNCIDHLPKLADTLAALEEAEFEVILVDDGSSDGSGDYCDKIALENQRVRVLHKPNGGVSSARNMGLAAAKGEFIGFLDADDAPKPHMYRLLTESARSCGSDLVMGGYEKADSHGTTPVSLPLEPVIAERAGIRKVAWSMAFWNAWVDGAFHPTLYGSVWPNLYRRGLIETHSIRFPEGVAIGEDLLFNLEYLFHARKISVVNEPLYRYNIANSSATRRQNKSLWQRYCALLDREEALLLSQYGPGQDLNYNLHRQRIYYAVNVGEEQLCVFLKGREAVSALRLLCADPGLQASAKYLIKNGKSVKERIQAALIRGKLAEVLLLWLK